MTPVTLLNIINRDKPTFLCFASDTKTDVYFIVKPTLEELTCLYHQSIDYARMCKAPFSWVSCSLFSNSSIVYYDKVKVASFEGMLDEKDLMNPASMENKNMEKRNG